MGDENRERLEGMEAEMVFDIKKNKISLTDQSTIIHHCHAKKKFGKL